MPRRQKKNHLLEQRLLAIEQRLQAFEDRREDMAPAQRQTGDSITAGSTPSLDGISVGTARPRTHFESQDDVVDGMGSVPLRDVKDEDEYFGRFLFLFSCLHAFFCSLSNTDIDRRFFQCRFPTLCRACSWPLRCCC